MGQEETSGYKAAFVLKIKISNFTFSFISFFFRRGLCIIFVKLIANLRKEYFCLVSKDSLLHPNTPTLPNLSTKISALELTTRC